MTHNVTDWSYTATERYGELDGDDVIPSHRLALWYARGLLQDQCRCGRCEQPGYCVLGEREDCP